MEVDADLLAAIVSALEEPERARPAAAGAAILRRTADEGFLPDWRLEDYLHAADPRLIGPFSGMDVPALAVAAKLHPINTTPRPRARSNAVVFSTGWSAEDAASLLILLQDLGFQVDPTPLVTTLRDRLPRRGLITEVQLDILWYERTRGKQVVRLSVAPEIPHRETRAFVTPRGYKVEVWTAGDGRPTHIEVRGPKHRKSRPPVETRCPQCGLTWYRGDPDSSACHRREHRERMVYLDPSPDPNMVAAMRSEPDPERVTWRSPAWKQDGLDERARLFREETHYGFVGWGAAYEKDHKAQGFLMTRPDGTIVGVVVFRWRDYSNAPAAWALQWVWVCPAARRSGVLRSRWAGFRAEFENFAVEGPVSDDMQAFLRAVEPGHHRFPSDGGSSS